MFDYWKVLKGKVTFIQEKQQQSSLPQINQLGSMVKKSIRVATHTNPIFFKFHV